MDVKEAARLAKQYVRQLFEEESAQNIGLEEIEYEENAGTWKVTVGLSRPWDREAMPPPPLPSIAEIMGTPRKFRRDMKMVLIDDSTGNVISVKNRA